MLTNKKERTPSPDPPGPMKNPNPATWKAKTTVFGSTKG